MDFGLRPVQLRDVADAGWSLVIEAPDRPEDESSVEEFFQGIKSRLEEFLNLANQRKLVCVSIVLLTSDGIGPTSSFLPALCTFLRDHEFVVAANRTRDNPLQMIIGLASDLLLEDDENGDEDGGRGAVVPQFAVRSDPIVQEATDQICRAFWDNDRFRVADFVDLDVPVVPAGDVLTLFFEAYPPVLTARFVVNVFDPTQRNLHPTGDLRRGNRSRIPDILRLHHRRGVQVTAEGPVQGANAARQVLRSSSSSGEPSLIVHMSTPCAAAAFVQGLTECRHHPFRAIALCAFPPEELGIAVPHGPGEPAKLDAEADLCHALLRCPSLKHILFAGFEFSSSILAAALEAMAPAPPSPSARPFETGSAALHKVQFYDCNFPDPAVGPAQMAIAMSRNGGLDHLDCAISSLSGSHMALLCATLTESDWELKSLGIRIGLNEDSMVLEDEQVKLFFRHLPSMKRLKILTFESNLPWHLSSTVADGFKNNYWLESLTCPDFAADPEVSSRLQDEITSFVVANRTGRTKVYEAVSNPNDRQLRGEAIEVLCRLSASDDLDDATSLFLCLQLFLPSLTRARNPASH